MAEEIYEGTTARLHLREIAQVRAMFDGFTLLEPGLVRVGSWRPENRLGADAGDRTPGFVAGVGLKPPH